jgi:hypothetical protein
MTEPLIRDIPSIKKNLEDVENLRALKRAMPLLRPILRLLKADTDKIDEAFANFDELEQIAEELANIPDCFNDLFSERGWIIYDLMNLEVAKAAIEKAEAGDIDGAEADLVDYYDAETVTGKLRTMIGLEAFRPRMRLAEKALDDYRNERYHACIPVVLALLDGLVNELYEKRRGFFAEDVNLEAWDSIAAHSKGLNVLTDIFKKGRRKTITEQITIPYRNGILHGMDLGYDNKMVAAKTWAALFAARDWAIRAERGLLEAPPEEPQKTWGEIIQQIRDVAEEKERLEAWRPRFIQPGVDLPTAGDPDCFESGTPERRLVEYLTYWKSNNYGYMAKCLSPSLWGPVSKLAGRLREKYGAKHLETFEFTEVSDDSAAVTKIQTNLVYEEDGKEVEKSVRFRMIYEDSDGLPAVRGKPEGTWIVVDWNTV